MSTSSTPHRFLDPMALAALGDLHLAARTLVDGLLLGRHRGRRSGTGQEFNQYRAYEPGDDLRLLDWKMYARSDRYYVREAVEDNSIRIYLLLDTSASMAHRDSSGTSKWEMARLAAAALAYLATNQGDAVGLLAADPASHPVPARVGRRHSYRLLHALEALMPGGRWPTWDKVESLLMTPRHRGLFVVFSDLHQHGEEIRDSLKRLGAMGHELSVIHLQADNEWDLPYSGPVEFQDMETGKLVRTVPAKIRDDVRRSLQAEQERWRGDLLDLGADYNPWRSDEAPDRFLRSYLRRRAVGS